MVSAKLLVLCHSYHKNYITCVACDCYDGIFQRVGVLLLEWVRLPAAVPDPKTFRVACSLNVEVHPLKGKAKQGAKSEVKEIQDAVNMILNDPTRPLAQTLLADYMIIVRDVSTNPFKVCVGTFFPSFICTGLFYICWREGQAYLNFRV
jgi:hypothetical protein